MKQLSRSHEALQVLRLVAGQSANIGVGCMDVKHNVDTEPSHVGDE